MLKELQIEIMSSSKRPGTIVQHEDGRRGRTYNDKPAINGKIPVYFDQGDFQFSENGSLVDPAKLTVTGFID